MILINRGLWVEVSLLRHLYTDDWVLSPLTSFDSFSLDMLLMFAALMDIYILDSCLGMRWN